MSNDGVSRRHFFFGSLLAGAVPAAGTGYGHLQAFWHGEVTAPLIADFLRSATW